MAEKIKTISENKLDENSPSKVMRKVGMYATMGLAIGLEDAAGNVYKAASSVAEGSIDGMNDGMGRLQDVLSSELDYNPIITPIFDLSIVKSQMAELNSMLNAGAYAPGANFNTVPAPTQEINFTQNNYSPKALSRIDIYRQTKNQISMMKGAMANA